MAAVITLGGPVGARQAPERPPVAESGVSAPVPQGIVGWWRGEGNANDAIGNNQGVLLNGASFAAGFVGTAFRFDGINDVVSIPDAPGLQLNLSSPRTIEAWAFRTSATSPMHLVGRRAGCGFGIDFYQLAIGNNAIPSNSVPLNVWSHLATTYDGVVDRQYVNGAVVFQRSVAYTPGPASAPLLIGSSGSCQPFAGLIDEVSLYNRALSAQEIQAIVAAGSEGKAASGSLQPPSGLLASVTGSTVLLTWDASAGATSYRLQWGSPRARAMRSMATWGMSGR